jgi:hypothetical protein
MDPGLRRDDGFAGRSQNSFCGSAPGKDINVYTTFTPHPQVFINSLDPSR